MVPMLLVVTVLLMMLLSCMMMGVDVKIVSSEENPCATSAIPSKILSRKSP